MLEAYVSDNCDIFSYSGEVKIGTFKNEQKYFIYLKLELSFL